ncbi:MAG: signal peptide peptidase SppA [Pedobacter sp.]|nr:MAG: signal peptide peptidase SppA [Pedobacter sp.]
MKEFFKFVFASMMGVILSFFVLLVLFVAVLTAVISIAGRERKAEVNPNSVLHITLSYPILERTVKNPLNNLDFIGYENNGIGLNDILAGIEKATTDKNIKGIYLNISSLSTGYASIEEIRNALVEFKKSGKFIIAYSEVYTQGAYYLASVADKLYLNPEGMIDFRGLSSEIPFFKKALDKLEIEVQVIKVGTYKSAVEPFVLEKMSEPNRTQVKSFLGSMYDHLLGKVAESRKLPKDSVYAISYQAKLRNATDALHYKMVDGLRYKDEIIDELKSLTSIAKDKDVKSISLEKYAPTDEEKESHAKNRIALVYATGDIISGEGSDQTIGSERISRALREARTDDKVKAIVLRINSPGGSSLASDVIWREVMLTKKAKPVIVSMGDVAASGGYYIACAADSIFAQPTTITGSIGVFGLIPNMQRFFNNKLGITFDGVQTGLFSNTGSIIRPLTEAEKMIIQNEVNHIYNSFTSKVAEGRKKSQSYIDGIAQGRVWSGKEALTNGLVDRLGNIHDAISSAAKKAGLDTYQIVDYPTLKDPLLSLFSHPTDKLKTYLLKSELGENYLYYQTAKSALNNMGIQSRLPYNVTVK